MKTNLFKALGITLTLFLFSALFVEKASAQVTFLDSSIVTTDAFYFWKPDDPKPYHYGASINPHGNCVKVSNGYVFYTWYRGGWSDRTLMVSRKKIGEGSWVHVALPPKLSLVGGKGDTHLTTNIGICPIDGSVHLIFDLHNENLKYIRSKSGVAFGSDSEFKAANFLPQQNYLIPGKVVSGVTYPDMFNNDQGDMYFERRLGSAVGGNIVMTYYNGSTWSPETTVLQGTGNGVSQGERNFCYGNAELFNGQFYYCYSVRWAESPTTLNEGVYLMDLGAKMDKTATNVQGRSYDLPIIDHAPFLIADPRSVPDKAGWAGGPQVAISPKNDIYLNLTPKGTSQYNYLKKAGETEFTEYRNKGALGHFYGNRMYKFGSSGEDLVISSCLAGTYDWREDFRMNVGARFRKSLKIMDNGTIVAVYAEALNSEKVPIHCYVFKIEKSEYKPQTITFTNIPEKTEGDADFALSATSSSGLPVTYTTSDPSIARIVEGNKVKIYGVGSCNIIANQVGNGTYDNAPEVSKTLVVKANAAKSNQTIQFTLANATHVWGSADQVLGATASSGLAVQYESSDPEVAVIVDGKLQVKRAGETTISAMQPGNVTYNAAPIVSYQLTVPKRKQELIFEAIPEKTAADPGFQLKATSNNPDAKLRYVCSNNQLLIVWNDQVREIFGAGTADIILTEEGNDYFTPAQVKQTVVIKPKIHVLPANVEAEYYTSKSGVDVTRWSNTVFYLNSWGTNDFSEYTIDAPADGAYEIEVFAASPSSSKKISVKSGTATLATMSLTVTPSLTVFKSTKANIALKKGVQNIKIVGVLGGFNFDKMSIKPTGGIVIPPDTTVVTDPVVPMPYGIASVDTEQIPNVATNLFDGNVSDDSRWSAQVYPKTVVIDLGDQKNIIGTNVWTYQSRAYQYTVEISDSATSGFTQVVDRSSNTSADQPISDEFDVTIGRFVRLTVIGCHNYSNNWVSINEVEILYADEEPSSTARVNANLGAIRIYPNPTSSSFKITLNNANDAQVQIFNMSGKMVYNAVLSNKSIDLATGIYLVKVKDLNNNVYRKKLVVE